LRLSWPWSYGSLIYNYLCNQCLSPLMLWVRISIRARCTTLCDKVYQWLVTGRWFSQGPPVSSANKTDYHDITEILLKMTLNTTKQTKQTNIYHNSANILTLIYSPSWLSRGGSLHPNPPPPTSVYYIHYKLQKETGK
jgi:hypothetical protein